MKLTHALVSVIDDDKSVRESLPDLLQEFGFSAKTFSSGKEFLASDAVDKTKCLILDVAMPGMTGPELQVELARRRKMIPIIYITALRDSTIRQRLIEQVRWSVCSSPSAIRFLVRRSVILEPGGLLMPSQKDNLRCTLT